MKDQSVQIGGREMNKNVMKGVEIDSHLFVKESKVGKHFLVFINFRSLGSFPCT